MKKVCCIILLILVAASAQSQKTKDRGSWYFTNGVQFFRPSNLNAAANPLGYPSLTSYFASGFGGYGEINHWIIGGEGAYASSTFHSGEKSAKAMGGLGYFYAGYKIVETSHWKIFPTIGFGIGGITYVLTDPVFPSSTLNNILTSQPNSRSFDNGSALLHLGIAAEYRLRQRFYFGFKTGYNMALSGATSWTAEGLNESLSVKDAFGGAYAQLQFGYYFRSKD